MARKRTKSGRFAKSRKRAVKRRTYRVRRRNPARTGSYYPKKGQRRLAAPSRRRAYTRRRRNQKGILASPAVKYSIAAGVGVGLAAWADTSPMLNPTKEDGTSLLPWGIKGSVLGGIVTLLLAQYGLKGQNRQLARAAAVGMFVPTALSTVQNAMTPGTTGGAYRMAARRPFRALPRQSHAAASFAAASHSLDNVA